MTPEDHPAIRAAVAAYRGVVTPARRGADGRRGGGRAAPEPRVDRWIFSTDGVGFPVPVGDESIAVPAAQALGRRRATCSTRRCSASAPGIEQNTHKIGECVDARELQHAIALLARFPSVFAATARA